MRSRFQIERRLTSGGMAEVFLARDATGARIAVKRVHEHLRDEDEFVERFASEARLAMALDHPNIVRVLETGEDEGVPFIAMQWLDGLDVRELLGAVAARSERLDPTVACAIAMDVARGLHHAHTLADANGRPLGVVHRDVSPHNVFVTREGHAKLFDFGIARSAMQLARSRAGEVRGKLGYMAPEQLAGLDVDARTDLFALGVLLWEMLVGRRLWQRGSPDATAYAIHQQGASPPSQEVPGLPRQLDAIVLALLAKLPAGRPRDANLVAGWLASTVRGFGCTDPIATVAAVAERYAPATEAARVHYAGDPWDEESTASK